MHPHRRDYAILARVPERPALATIYLAILFSGFVSALVFATLAYAVTAPLPSYGHPSKLQHRVSPIVQPSARV